VDRALAESKAGERGAIVVSTQVIEAGVDISATTLFTELAPWASLVQRFGRCNRTGENREAQVLWIDVPNDQAAPYDVKDLEDARKQLQGIGKKPEGERDVGLMSLPVVPLRFDHTHVIRRKDLSDLFDTTPDLAGNDIDIDRFVRDIEDSDVRVFWREYGKTPNETDAGA
jgi:CRISPR-associated endonuclease/helicase Cas3